MLFFHLSFVIRVQFYWIASGLSGSAGAGVAAACCGVPFDGVGVGAGVTVGGVYRSAFGTGGRRK